MGTVDVVAAVLAAASGLVAAARLAIRGRAPVTAVAILGVAASAVFVALGTMRKVGSEVVVVMDRLPPGELKPDLGPLLSQIDASGARRVGVIGIDPEASEPTAFEWAPVGDPAAARSRAGRARTPDEAITAALASPTDRGWYHAVLSAVGGSDRRVVIAVSDPDRWVNWLPVHVEQRLADARKSGALVDRVSLLPSRETIQLDVQAPLGLPLGRSLTEYTVPVVVTAKAPAPLGTPGQVFDVHVEANLDRADPSNANSPTVATASFDATATVRATGDLSVWIPTQKFSTPSGASPQFDADGFVRCGVRLEIKGSGPTPLIGTGASYLPLRRSEVVIACGSGDGLERLLAAPPPGTPEAARIESLAKALTDSDRGRSAGRFTFLTPNQVLARLKNPTERLSVVVLHEMPSDFWKVETLDLLSGAVKNGLTLLVTPAPVPPADPNVAAKLRALLPAVGTPDPRTAPNVTAVTIDRTMMLTFVFDAASWGQILETPGKDGVRKPLPPALPLQVLAANKMLQHLSAMDVAHGTITPGANGSVGYTPTPGKKDRVTVRVCPRVATAHRLADRYVGSAIEFRLAAGFANLPKLLIPWADYGLVPPPPAAPYPLDDPGYTTNHAVVLFCGNIPQPELNALLPETISFTAGDMPPRVMKQTPPSVLAELMRRGATVAAVRIDTTPEYHTAWAKLPTQWPGPGPNLITKFTLAPDEYLETFLPVAVKKGCTPGQGGAGPLALPEAAVNRRLIRTDPAKPWFRVLTLTDVSVQADAEALGSELAATFKPLFASPRSGMSVAVTGWGRFVDERIGPGLPKAKLVAGAALDTAWPEAMRPPAARRARLMASPPEFPAEARGTFGFAVDTGPPQAQLGPLPALVGGVLGRGHLLVCSYSPFENDPAWADKGREHVICPIGGNPNFSADVLGPQRLLDLATFIASRLEKAPAGIAILRAVRHTDARGGMELTVAFAEEHSRRRSFWEPRVASVDGIRQKTLSVRDVDWPGRTATFVLSPEDAVALAGATGERIAPDFGDGVDLTCSFLLPKPPETAWRYTPSLGSCDVLAANTGGSVEASELKPLTRPVRPWAAIAVAFFAALAALARGSGRWRKWVFGLKAEGALPEVDTAALAEEYGRDHAPSRPTRYGTPDGRLPLGPGGRLDAVPVQHLVRWLIGIPGIPEVDHRLPHKAAQIVIVVSMGASARASGRGRPRVALMSVLSTLLAEIYWLRSASVRVIGTGLAGGPQSFGPATGREAGQGLDRAIQGWAERGTAPLEGPDRLDVLPGATVFWISDFVEENPDALMGWAEELADGGGRLAGVMAVSAGEFNRVGGLGVLSRPLGAIDRTESTRGDLRDGFEAEAAELRATFARRGIPLAIVAGELDGQALVEEFDRAGILLAPGE